MKKIIWAVVCFVLACPLCAQAEQVFTLNGAALNQAQRALLASSESVTITETDVFDGETSVSVLWHGGDRFTLMEEDGTITHFRPDYACRLAPESANAETLVFMPDVLAEIRSGLVDQLTLFDNETDYLFAAQPDGLLTAVDTYDFDGGPLTEAYTISPDTHTLAAYAARQTDASGAVLEAVDVQIAHGGDDPFASFFADWPETETFPLTLVAQSGDSIRIDVPLYRTVRFSDGIDDVLMFADAALTVPVDCIQPAEIDASAGLTLYEGLSDAE